MTDNRWVKQARDRGARARRNGIPYADCPYLFDSDEGRAWKNAWLAEAEPETSQ